MSDEHLSTEEISALLDRAAGEAGEGGHVDECTSCRREMELLRRMRMALSALDDRDAPRESWASVEAGLEGRGLVEPSGGNGAAASGRPFFSVDAGWVRVAAAAVLFVGGLGLGTHLASPGDAGGGEGAEGAEVAATASGTEGGAASDASGQGRPEGSATASRTSPESGLVAAGDDAAGAGGLTYREAMERLEELRARGPTFREAYRNPAEAAEHLARLEALMRASQEALREDPADPALNDFLFEVAEERRTLNRALQLSSLEYR